LLKAVVIRYNNTGVKEGNKSGLSYANKVASLYSWKGDARISPHIK